MANHFLRVGVLACAALALAACSSGSSSGGNDEGDTDDPVVTRPPNILVVIMDDVGIDQMTSFGYGGLTAPVMANMDTVAQAGLRFRNTWAMPECSPSRAALMAGRYPFRTNIQQAIGANDLANSQLSPYEVTAPKLLKAAGYESAMFGKFHLAGPHHNPAGNMTPQELGWDYFYGWIDGVPGSIDGTAGGVAPEKTHRCGFVPSHTAGGANRGACYYADNTCAPMHHALPHDDAPGLQCLASGGIFVAEQACGTPPASLNFNRENAHYVSPLVIIDGDQLEEVPLSDPRSRGYRTQIEADAAINWIKSRAGSDTPWMATVSFSAAHTPIQPPPAGLVPGGQGVTGHLDCFNAVQNRATQNRMTEALDTEFGRILVETGLASRDDQGGLVYDPQVSHTVVVIIGDNGTFGFAVKRPFDATRAKGTSYQTGVWVPLIVAGPPVQQPDRDVEHMVNVVDVFQLFGELAGIDVHAAVPRAVDSAPMLPYLHNPDQASVRSLNFSMSGFNIQKDGGENGPCVLDTACTQIPLSKSVCEDNLGVWWGQGHDDPSVLPSAGNQGYKSCCAVNQALHKDGRSLLNILPASSVALRNSSNLKLVRNTVPTYDTATDTCGPVVIEELYTVNQATPRPLLDRADRNLLDDLPLPDALHTQYVALQAQMDAILASEPSCPGDGNLDGVVDAQDMDNWRALAMAWGQSSVYDMLIDGKADGLTNQIDGQVITRHLGTVCPPATAVY